MATTIDLSKTYFGEDQDHQFHKVITAIAQSNGETETPDTTPVVVLGKDSDGNVTNAKGTTVPSAEAGYALECGFVDTDKTAGTHKFYKNIGTALSCVFNLVGVVDLNAEIGEEYIQVATIEVSAAEIVLLNSAPKELVAAPGADKAIDLISMAIDYAFDTAAYTTNGDLTAQTGATGTAQSDAVAGADLLLGGASVTISVQALSADHVLDKNESIVLAVATGEAVNPGTAAGTMKVKVAYRVLDFS